MSRRQLSKGQCIYNMEYYNYLVKKRDRKNINGIEKNKKSIIDKEVFNYVIINLNI